MQSPTSYPTARAEICEVGRRMWQRGLVAANDGNISVRLDDGTILCTPTGISKGAMSPSDLIRVGLDGAVVEGGASGGPSSELPMHLRCYQVDPSVHAVVHAHSVYATAFAIRGEPLIANSMPEAVVLLGDVPVAPYAVPSTDEVPNSIEPLIMHHRAALLEHHGALTWSQTLEQAYLNMERVEQVASITAAARGLGGERPLSPSRLKTLRELFVG